METLVIIVFVILGIFVAKLTWKFYPLYLSKSYKYRNSPIEIQKQRAIKTLSAFIVTCVCGAIVISTMRGVKTTNPKVDTEVIKTKKNKKKKVEYISEEKKISVEKIPEKLNEDSLIQLNLIIDSTELKTTNDTTN